MAGVAAALIAVVAIATAAVLRNRASPLSRAGGPPTFHRVEGFSEDIFITGIPSFDGRYVPFSESTAGDLAVLELATGTRRRLTNNVSWDKSGDYAMYSIVSADGTQVAYSWAHKDGSYDVRIIGIDGGAPRVLFSDPQAADLQVADWSRDGKYLLVGYTRKDKSGQIGLVSVADGSFRLLKSGDFVAWGFSLSPDGRFVVYDRPSGGATNPHDIYLLATDGSRDEPLVQDPANDSYPLWTPDGRGVIFASDRSGRLGAWLVRVHEGKPDGPPEVVNKDMGPMMPMGITAQSAYYYMLRTGMVDVYQAQLDPVSGKARQAPTPATRSFAGSNISPDWSPDGRHLVYVSQRGTQYAGPGSRVLVIRDMQSGQERQVAPKFDFYINPRWSPDGGSILLWAIGGDLGGEPQIHRVDLETGATELVRVGAVSDFAWHTDGRSIFYLEAGAIRQRDLRGGRERVIFRPDPSGGARAVAVSPDGLSLAVTGGDQSGRSWIRVVPTDGGTPRDVVQATKPEGLDVSGWTPDGRHLMFVKWHDSATPGGQEEARDLWRIPVEGGRAEPVGIKMTGLRELRVHPDGTRVAFTAGWPIQELWVGENFLSKPGK